MTARPAALRSFASLLRRMREAVGHDNPHSFFEAQGGRAFFGCSYRAYLSAEAGLSLPKPAVVERLAAALWLSLDEGKAREFAHAYVRAAVADEAFAGRLLDSLARPPARRAPGDADRETLLSRAQVELFYRSEDCYWCFTALANDDGRWTAEELARALALPASRVRAALARLARVKAVSAGADGRWSCPYKGALLFHPKGQPYPERELAALRRHWTRAAARGGLLQEHPVLTRCAVSDVTQYLPYLMNALLGAESVSRRRKGPDTGFFLLELLVEKLVDF